MASQLALPLELVDKILGGLDPKSRSGRATLSSFSCTNRAFSILCQKRLFYHIRIVLVTTSRGSDQESTFYLEDAHTTGAKLLELLNSSPHLAAYIRSVLITAWLRPGLKNDGTAKSSASPLFPLYSIMPKLSSLKTLHFFGHGSLYSWPNLEPTMRAFLPSIVKDLCEIDISQFLGVPTSFFAKCLHLRNAVVSNLLVAQDTALPSTKTQLDFLEVRENLGEGRLKTWIQPKTCPFDITRLTALFLSVRDFEPLSLILTQCSSSLKVLELRLLQTKVDSHVMSTFSLNNDEPINLRSPAPPNLDRLHSLRRLTLRSVIGRSVLDHSIGDPHYHTNIPYVASMLDTLPRNSRSPKLKIIFEICIQGINAEDELESLAWAKLLGYVGKERHSLCVAQPIELVWDRYINRAGSNSYIGDDSHTRLRDIWERDPDLRKLREANLIFTSFANSGARVSGFF
ncbi:hypothetical protein CVT26_005119 [Gymnopilus dilepis]|uniref:F-box domain-containing protein n=1 Tax=Gymnopilus dilepis TaxID=231916 RepID=A0A409Y094_9AGAR|nr:hypothetical protein CVT26_005119 [Gymnopilus dilepis]